MVSLEVLGISFGVVFGVVLMLFLVSGNVFGWLLFVGSFGVVVMLLIIMIVVGCGGFFLYCMLLVGMVLSIVFIMFLMML